VAVRRDGNLVHFIAQVVNTRAIGVTSVAARPETDDRRVERALVRHRADTGVHPYEKYTRAIGVPSVAARPETDDRRVEQALVRHRADTALVPYVSLRSTGCDAMYYGPVCPSRGLCTVLRKIRPYKKDTRAIGVEIASLRSQ